MPHVSVPRQGPLGKGSVVAAWEHEALRCVFSALLSSLSQLSCILLLPLLFFLEEGTKGTKASSPSRFSGRARTSLDSSPGAGCWRVGEGRHSGHQVPPEEGPPPPRSGHSCLLPGRVEATRTRGRDVRFSPHLDLIRLPFLRLWACTLSLQAASCRKSVNLCRGQASGGSPGWNVRAVGTWSLSEPLCLPGLLLAPRCPQPGSSRNSEPGDYITFWILLAQSGWGGDGVQGV